MAKNKTTIEKVLQQAHKNFLNQVRSEYVQPLVQTNRYYKVSEVAKIFDVTTTTVRNWIHSGKFPAVRIGRDYQIDGKDLHKALIGKS